MGVLGANAALVGIERSHEFAKGALSGFLNFRLEGADAALHFAPLVVVFLGRRGTIAQKSTALGEVVEGTTELMCVEGSIEGSCAEEPRMDGGFGVVRFKFRLERGQDGEPRAWRQKAYALENTEDFVEAALTAAGLAAGVPGIAALDGARYLLAFVHIAFDAGRKNAGTEERDFLGVGANEGGTERV